MRKSSTEKVPLPQALARLQELGQPTPGKIRLPGQPSASRVSGLFHRGVISVSIHGGCVVQLRQFCHLTDRLGA